VGRRPTTRFEARGLPDGLEIHEQTGVIHGTPTSAGKSEGCCVKVFNDLGFFEETLDIHTIEPKACSNLTYTLSMPEDGVLLKDDKVQITPSFDIGFPDGFTCFSVKPDLPPGLRLNSQSGTISGTPTISTDRTEYTVTLENKMRYFGDILLSETAVTMILEVQTHLKPQVSYANTLRLSDPIHRITYVGGDFKDITPSFDQQNNLHFSVDPPLPSGLSLNDRTGVISGKAEKAPDKAEQTYVVECSNKRGIQQIFISIVVAKDREEYLRYEKTEQERTAQRNEEQARLALEKQLKEQEDQVKTLQVELSQRKACPLGRHGAPVPGYWKCQNSAGYQRVPSLFVKGALEQFMRESSVCCSGSGTSMAKVVSVERIENFGLWQKYQTQRAVLLKFLESNNASVDNLSAKTRWRPKFASTKDLSSEINEFYLFHGTSLENAHIIAEHGFDERKANLGGLYGAGTYFAINACKSQQYSTKHSNSGQYVMLVCRVILGIPFCTTAKHHHDRRAPDNPATAGRPYDSIFAERDKANGGQQKHNEYVVFDRTQIYPEYLVRYTVNGSS
jgi:hypothetical protein